MRPYLLLGQDKSVNFNEQKYPKVIGLVSNSTVQRIQIFFQKTTLVGLQCIIHNYLENYSYECEAIVFHTIKQKQHIKISLIQ